MADICTKVAHLALRIPYSLLFSTPAPISAPKVISEIHVHPKFPVWKVSPGKNKKLA